MRPAAAGPCPRPGRSTRRRRTIRTPRRRIHRDLPRGRPPVDGEAERAAGHVAGAIQDPDADRVVARGHAGSGWTTTGPSTIGPRGRSTRRPVSSGAIPTSTPPGCRSWSNMTSTWSGAAARTAPSSGSRWWTCRPVPVAPADPAPGNRIASPARNASASRRNRGTHEGGHGRLLPRGSGTRTPAHPSSGTWADLGTGLRPAPPWVGGGPRRLCTAQSMVAAGRRGPGTQEGRRWSRPHRTVSTDAARSPCTCSATPPCPRPTGRCARRTSRASSRARSSSWSRSARVSPCARP